jgi:hypothetical protein
MDAMVVSVSAIPTAKIRVGTRASCVQSQNPGRRIDSAGQISEATRPADELQGPTPEEAVPNLRPFRTETPGTDRQSLGLGGGMGGRVCASTAHECSMAQDMAAERNSR